MITTGEGTARSLSRSEYEALALGERIQPLLEGRLKFFLQGEEIPPRQALKVS